MADIFHAHLRAMENTHTDVKVSKVKELILWEMYRQFKPLISKKLRKSN